jgi:hypothetical protein
MGKETGRYFHENLQTVRDSRVKYQIPILFSCR